MTIVELCFSDAWGGLEHNCAYDAWLLKQRGHSVIPLVHSGSRLAKRFEELGMEARTLPALAYVSPLATLWMAFFFKRHRVDAVHLHRTQDLGPALSAAALAGVPSRALTLRMESHRLKKDPYHRWVYHRLTTLLTLTDRMAELVKTNVAVDPAIVQRLYNGVDADALKAEALPRPVIRRKWGIPQDAFVVGITGRIEGGKGQHLLVKACGTLRAAIPKLYVMIVGEEIVGQKGEINRLKQLIEELGMTGRVIFTGNRRPAGVITPAMDVSVLATRKETFGTALIEAQALGVPVIGSNAGGVPEIIEPGRTGLLFTPDDYEDLAEKIYLLYRDFWLRALLGKQAEAAVREKFSVERHVEGLERAIMNFKLYPTT